MCSENKGADQLGSYCKAELRLYFRLCRLLVFPCCCSFIILYWFGKLMLLAVNLLQTDRQANLIDYS